MSLSSNSTIIPIDIVEPDLDAESWARLLMSTYSKSTFGTETPAPRKTSSQYSRIITHGMGALIIDGFDERRNGFYHHDSFQEKQGPDKPNLVEESLQVTITDPPPDGGAVAWRQVFVAHLLCVNSFGYISSFGVFQSYYTELLHRPQSDISWVGSIQLFLLFFIGTFSGRAMDAGFFKSLIIVGCIIQTVGVFLTSISKQYWQLFLTQGVIQGLAYGLLFTPTVALVSTYFSKKRAFALGLTACGAPVGGVIFPVIARQLFPKIGFGWTIRVMGFVVLFNCIVICLLMKPRKVNRVKGPLVEWAAFKEVPYTLFTIGMFLGLWGIYFAYYYLTVYAKTVVGATTDQSLNLLMMLNGIGIIARLLPPFLADRYLGAYNTLIPTVFLSGVFLFIWISIHTYNSMIAFSLIYGFWAQAVQTLFPAALSSLTVDLSKIGVRVGMVFTVMSVSCLTGPPIAGAMISAQGGNFLGAQLFGGVSMVVGTVFLVMGRVVQMRNGGGWRA